LAQLFAAYEDEPGAAGLSCCGLGGASGVLGEGARRLQIMRPVCRSQLQDLDLFDVDAAAAISGASNAKHARAMSGRCGFTRPAYTVIAMRPNSGLSYISPI